MVWNSESQRSDAYFAAPAVDVERRADGCILLRSPQQLTDYGRCVGDWLSHWATTAPDRPFLLERDESGGRWTGVTYGEALTQVRCIAAWLLRAGCSVERQHAVVDPREARGRRPA